MLVAGRIAGWLMIALALLMASGDAVLAFGTGDHEGLMASTLWTLMTGHSPDAATTASFGAMLLAWPAWAAIGPVGLALVFACRPRRRRFRYRRTHD
jgi:hypothetical protein